ncbi:MAG: HdeD family acid-resistance protein [Thermoguttaceae bacterium]
MSNESQTSVGQSSAPGSGPVVRHELQYLQRYWFWPMLLGYLLVLCGAVALVYPAIASVAAVSVLAAILMIAGLATIIGSFWAGKWSGFLVHLLVGILYLAAGVVITERPFVNLLIITFFAAVLFMVVGSFRVVAALVIRFPQWGWAVLNGAVTFLVGLIIYRHLPLDALWVVGILVGVEMLLNGWTWIMLAAAIKAIPKET